MQTPTGKAIDNYYNRYDPEKDYTEILYRAGYGTQASEMNELQSMQDARIRAIADSLFKDGDIVSGCQIAVDAATGETRCEAGTIYLQGRVWKIEQAVFAIPLQGTVSVGVRLKESIISELEDPGLLNPARGSRGEGEPGAWRKKSVVVWGHDGDGGDGNFYTVHVVDDGVPRAKELPPNLDSFSQGIAKYDRDSTGGGTYVSSGLLVQALADTGAGAQVFSVSEGRARVNGYGVDLLTARRLSYAAEPDLRFVDTEVIQATGDETQRINVAHPPIRNITALRVTLQKTASIVHGSYNGCADDLPDTSVMSIVEVRQGDTVYEAESDYIKTGDTVDWSPAGNEPAPGSTIQVTYTYLDKTLEPTDVDYDGFSVSGAVAGTGIMVSYNQALPRIDRLCLSSEGAFSFIRGVAAERNAKAPAVPEGLLALASISQTWRDRQAVVNDGVRVVPFSDIEALMARVEYALGEIARQRLEADVATREAGARVGLFVDALLDDSMRDQGIPQSAAIVNGYLTLPLAVSAYALSQDIKNPTARSFTPQPVLSQPYRTGSMKINPYMAFAVLPAKAKITPDVDRWLDRQAQWTSAATRYFYRQIYAPNHPQHGQTVRTTTNSIETVSTTQKAAETLRRISIAFELSGFGAGEILREISFDGIVVPAAEGELAAGADGVIRGHFTIPANVPAGVKEVIFRGAVGGSEARASFVGQGTVEVTTLRQVQTVTDTNIDPLAQTFMLDAPTQVAGIDLWFTAKGESGVRVQLRETSNGVPTRVVLCEAIVPAADIVASGGGHTRVLFDAPVALLGETEYAIVVLCNDAETELSIAEMGGFDKVQQQWITTQPYTIGTLLSSSNASSWTAHQTADLTFRLLRAAYAEGVNTLSLGNITVAPAGSDIMLLAACETPAAQTRCEYELGLPDGTSMTVAEDQPVRLSASVTGQVTVKARLAGDGSGSPVLWPGSQVLVGTLSLEADYYTRSIPASGAEKAVLVYNAEIPSGSAVTPQIQVDGGEWEDMTQVSAQPAGNGSVEYKFSHAMQTADLIKVRLNLSGTIASRPMVSDIRLMAIA